MSIVEKEFMLAGLKRERDLLNELIIRLNSKEDLDLESRTLYDQVTKEVEQNLKQFKKFRKHLF